MEYERIITREMVEDSLINGDQNPIHRYSKPAREFLEKINMGQLCQNKDVIVVPGALTINLMEFLDEIKNYYPAGLVNIEFDSPLVIENKSGAKINVKYNLERRVIDSPFINYPVKVKEHDRGALKGNIVVVTKEIYEHITKESIDKAISMPKIDTSNLKKNEKEISDSFEIGKDIIEPYCKSIGIRGEDYYKKYDDGISGMIMASIIPAKLFNIVKNESGFFAYKTQNMRIIKNPKDNFFEMKGVEKNLKNIIYRIGLRIKSMGNLLIESHTRAVRAA